MTLSGGTVPAESGEYRIPARPPQPTILPLSSGTNVYARDGAGISARFTARVGVEGTRKGRVSLRGFGQVVPVGVDDQFEAVGDAELVEDRGQVVPHGRLADEEALGDILVLQPLADQRDDL